MSAVMAFVPILADLVQALMPLVGKLVTGKITLAEAKSAADHAVAQYLHDSADLRTVEAADDAAADAAAASLPATAPTSK